jgi:hypothetical protein
MRGVGKTTLAASYAEAHRGDYRATWWIRALTEVGMRAELVALGVRLGWVGADKKEEPALSAVMKRLRHEGEGILLIFDNATDANALKPYRPPGGSCQVLVNSIASLARGGGASRNPGLARDDRRRPPQPNAVVRSARERWERRGDRRLAAAGDDHSRRRLYPLCTPPPEGCDIPDELKVKLFRAARGSLYRNDIDPCALPAIGGRNATLN